jgi:hypothetical protein
LQNCRHLGLNLAKNEPQIGRSSPGHITQKAGANQDVKKIAGLKVVVGLTTEYAYKSLFHGVSRD